MLFDNVRFDRHDFNYSRNSIKAFLKWLTPRFSMSERATLRTSLKQNPLAASETYKEKFGDFQREQVTNLVERIYRAVKKRRPGMIVSAAVFANDENAYTRRFQD